MTEPLKILISVTGTGARGGVTNYFRVLKKEFSNNVTYLERGNRSYPVRKNVLLDVIRIIKDIVLFLYHLIFKSYDLVHTNTSFYKNSIVRDAVFVLSAKLFKIKTIVFYRGWDEDFQLHIENRWLKLYKFVYFKADASIVLAQSFKDKLIEWGYNNPVYIETTLVDKELISDFHENDIINKYNTAILQNANILFLARIEKTKGIYEALKTFLLLQTNHPGLSLTVVGDGLELENLKRFVSEHGIDHVKILGYQSGSEKARAFKEASIYFFPSYTEGMPTSVLEAMAFGLPIITRPVGGLPDFFEQDKMGLLTESFEPTVFASLFEKLLQNPKKMKEIALYNFHYAKERFLSDRVVERMEQIYKNTFF